MPEFGANERTVEMIDLNVKGNKGEKKDVLFLLARINKSRGEVLNCKSDLYAFID